MVEIYCPFNGGEICPSTCPNYGHNCAESEVPEGLAGDLDAMTIKSTIIPGYSQESKTANIREMRRTSCELNGANKLFKRKKK